jgi:hypothetical protein
MISGIAHQVLGFMRQVLRFTNQALSLRRFMFYLGNLLTRDQSWFQSSDVGIVGDLAGGELI